MKKGVKLVTYTNLSDPAPTPEEKLESPSFPFFLREWVLLHAGYTHTNWILAKNSEKS